MSKPSQQCAADKALIQSNNSWPQEILRILRVAVEFMGAFRRFRHMGNAVTIFGSARFTEMNPFYQLAVKIGGGLAKQGIAVVTGGGPGIMEAASRGAFEAGGKTIGANIVLPREQKPNPFLTQLVEFNYFFTRKVTLVKYSHAYIFLPGGFGTLDELAEVLTLTQTGKLEHFPIILVGTEYWTGLLKWIENTMITHQTINPSEAKYPMVCDTPEEVLKITEEFFSKRKC